jgi:hypothetical protein
MKITLRQELSNLSQSVEFARQTHPYGEHIAGRASQWPNIDTDLQRAIRRRNISVEQVIRCAATACLEAGIELSRLKPRDEKQKIAQVRKHAENLLKAIQDAPLPKFDALGLKSWSEGDSFKRSSFYFAWKIFPRSGESAEQLRANIDRPIVATEFVELMLEKLDAYQQGLPSRAVQKVRSEPETLAFVRHFAFRLKGDHAIKNAHSLIALMANIICDSSFDHRELKKIL